SDAGANVVALDQRSVADLHACNISDCIERAGRQHANLDSEIANAKTSLSLCRRIRSCGLSWGLKDAGESQQKHGQDTSSTISHEGSVSCKERSCQGKSGCV